MDLVLISTTDASAARRSVLKRMLDSVERTHAALARPDRLRLSLLVQNATGPEQAQLSGSYPGFIEVSATPGRLSLSAARNAQLRTLLARGAISPDAVVGFPDDDCWYPEGLIAQLLDRFRGDASLDLWFCRYGSQPREPAIAQPRSRAPAVGAIVRNASSNTLFVRGRVATAVGLFDEALGVGTPAGGSEDLDYALRAWRIARSVQFHDEILVGHRDKSAVMRARYYGSALTVLARHGLATQTLRKLGVGVYLLLRGELPAAQFAREVGVARRAWRSAAQSGPVVIS